MAVVATNTGTCGTCGVTPAPDSACACARRCLLCVHWTGREFLLCACCSQYIQPRPRNRAECQAATEARNRRYVAREEVLTPLAEALGIDPAFGPWWFASPTAGGF